MSRGLRLGEGYSVPEFEEKSIQVNSGDLLFLYTDGLIEGKNLDGQQYTKMKAVKKLDSIVGHGPLGIIQTLSLEIDSHNEGKPLDDDITLTAIQIQKLGT